MRDTLQRGLILRIGAKGTKVREVVVSNGPKSRRRIRLGIYPALSVKDARIAAGESKEGANQPHRITGIVTVGDLFERYRTARADNMRSWRDVQSAWDVWGKKQLAHIRLSEETAIRGLELRDHVAFNSSPLRAASIIRYLRPMFGWAAEEQHVTFNPWAVLRPKVVAKARDRVLKDNEWLSVWQAAESIPYPFGPFVQALMLSAQRLSNVAQMRWDELHDDVWLIPADKVKATRSEKASAHEVPLSRAFAELIAAQPRQRPFVFTTTGDKAIIPGSKLKAKIERIVNASAADLKDAPLTANETLANWRFHDIRRSAATKMTGDGVSRFIVERVLGHADRGVTAVYDRNAYRDEKREALETLAATLVATLVVDPLKLGSTALERVNGT